MQAVLLAYTVAEPWAVMVVGCHAFVANTAVLRPKWLLNVAHSAESQLDSRLDYLW